ncbi:MAG: HD domain-containing protein [Nitrospirae bacterium]|jgi:HD-GYP domain-containing protein (c-di-GMP phosphodiesterase class II)|nr:HD domain-containing protein [Nitrospirota bacterium]
METLKRFISIFMSAVSNCSLYSKEHAFVDELSRKALSILGELYKEADSLEIMILEDDLIANKMAVRDIGIQGLNLIKRLKRKGISRIDFLKGITLSELKQLVADISTTEKGAKPHQHIKVGVVDIRIGRFEIDKDFDIDSLSNFTSEQVEKVKREYNSISPFKKLKIAGLEEIVVQFSLMVKKEINILKLLCPARSYSENDYTHATNVSVLTMFQAQTIGVREEFLRDIGIAALLHDTGKLLIPGGGGFLKRQDSSEAEENEETEIHPLYGAQYLAKINGLTRLAPIVAFEHHLRYDGRGYPKLKGGNIKQHICSQMTAISDYFDNLRSRKPYKGALEIKEALSLMKTKDEGLFNPFLIDNFIRSIHLALSG